MALWIVIIHSNFEFAIVTLFISLCPGGWFAIRPPSRVPLIDMHHFYNEGNIRSMWSNAVKFVSILNKITTKVIFNLSKNVFESFRMRYHMPWLQLINLKFLYRGFGYPRLLMILMMNFGVSSRYFEALKLFLKWKYLRALSMTIDNLYLKGVKVNVAFCSKAKNYYNEGHFLPIQKLFWELRNEVSHVMAAADHPQIPLPWIWIS